MTRPAHYAKMKIQPLDAIEAWGLSFGRGNIVKYVARAQHKGEELSDLVKAKFYLEREIAKVKKRRKR